MKKTGSIIMLMICAYFLTGCTPATNTNTNAANTGNANSANSNANTTKPTAAAPTKDALMTLEKAGWEAWKNRDAKWTEDNYSDKGFNLNSKGRTDKAAMIKAMRTEKCEIKSYSLADDKMTMAGPDLAVLTFKATQDGTCNGKKIPAAVYSASAYVREGDKWKAAFYTEAPVMDPKAPPAKAAPATPPAKDAAKPDAATQSLLDVETKAWDAWKNKDVKGLEEFAAKDLMALDAEKGWMDRATSINRWTDEPCQVKALSFSDAASTAFGTDASILTVKVTPDGKCSGQTLAPMWGVTVYVKESGTWKGLISMNVPAE